MPALKALVEHRSFQTAIILLIIVNAIILGIQALPGVGNEWQNTLKIADEAILWIFVGELVLRFAAHGRRFFKDPWSIFDFAVVAVSFVPVTGGFSALRAFRVFRVLRLVSAFPRLRSVVGGLLGSIPGIASVAVLLILIVFVSAIVGYNLFGAQAPDQFGDLWVAMFTLFKVMTLEGWPDIADAVMGPYPWAWIFFLLYILIATLTLLNFFVAIIVNAMEAEALENKATIQMQEQLFQEIQALRGEIEAFRAQQKIELDEIEEKLGRRDRND